MGSRIRGLVMPRCRSVNVDDEMDLTIANALIAGADEELR
jgi:CMP-N-acetylneuraminic acid synthetase